MEQASREHVAALVATVVVGALLVAGARLRGDAWSVPIGRGLAVVILGGFACEQLTYALRGQWTAKVNLPLQLTDAVTLASVAALWRPDSALLVELVYFWALSASLQAVLTPDLAQSFPDVLFFTYFATHSGRHKATIAASVTASVSWNGRFTSTDQSPRSAYVSCSPAKPASITTASQRPAGVAQASPRRRAPSTRSAATPAVAAIAARC